MEKWRHTLSEHSHSKRQSSLIPHHKEHSLEWGGPQAWTDSLGLDGLITVKSPFNIHHTDYISYLKSINILNWGHRSSSLNTYFHLTKKINT